MKATLSFTIPEEEDAFAVCVNSGKFYSALNTINELIRNKLKYDEMSKETETVLNEIRNLIPHEIHEIG